MKKIISQHTYLYPIYTVNYDQFVPNDLIFKLKGLEAEIIEFSKNKKKEVLGYQVEKRGAYYCSTTPAPKHLHEAIESHHALVFRSYPEIDFLSDLKTFHFRQFVEKCMLIVYNRAPECIFDICENAEKPVWFTSHRHNKYDDHQFVQLTSDNTRILGELLLNGFKNYSDKKIQSCLDLYATSCFKNLNLGLKGSLLVTILESFFAPDNPELKYKFSMRLTKFMNEDINSLKFYKDMYNFRSNYYHRGEIRFSNGDISRLKVVVQKVILSYMKNNESINIDKIDEELIS